MNDYPTTSFLVSLLPVIPTSCSESEPTPHQGLEDLMWSGPFYFCPHFPLGYPCSSNTGLLVIMPIIPLPPSLLLQGLLFFLPGIPLPSETGTTPSLLISFRSQLKYPSMRSSLTISFQISISSPSPSVLLYFSPWHLLSSTHYIFISSMRAEICVCVCSLSLSPARNRAGT